MITSYRVVKPLEHYRFIGVALAMAALAILAPAAAANLNPVRAPGPVVQAGPNADEAVLLQQPTQTRVSYAGPNPDETASGSRPAPLAFASPQPSSGFDWGDAAIGAAFAMAVVGIGGAALLGRRRLRKNRQTVTA
jgi:hypothetical protein